MALPDNDPMPRNEDAEVTVPSVSETDEGEDLDGGGCEDWELEVQEWTERVWTSAL